MVLSEATLRTHEHRVGMLVDVQSENGVGPRNWKGTVLRSHLVPDVGEAALPCSKKVISERLLVGDTQS